MTEADKGMSLPLQQLKCPKTYDILSAFAMYYKLCPSKYRRMGNTVKSKVSKSNQSFNIGYT